MKKMSSNLKALARLLKQENPGGHPKSPIHGHFKFPHLMAA